MAEQALAEHLALLARSGLMTHVAQLDPPVTAATMARFRADASAQSSNVMALSPGEFALCLAPNVRALASTVPHRLHPIAEHPLLTAAHAPASESPAPAPPTAQAGTPERMQGDIAPRPSAPPPGRERRILPTSLGPSAPAPDIPPDPQPPVDRSAAFAFPTLPEPAPADPIGTDFAPPPRPARDADHARIPRELQNLRTEQEALSGQIEGLAKHLGQIEASVERARDDTRRTVELSVSTHMREGLAALKTDVMGQLNEALSLFQKQAPNLQEDLRAAQAAQAEEARRAQAALQEDITEALHAAETAQRQRLESLSHDLHNYGLARAEDEARISEGFATIRLGLRAMNDRLADLSARVSLPSEAGVPASQWPSEPIQEPRAESGSPSLALQKHAPPPAERRITVVPPSLVEEPVESAETEAAAPAASLRTALRSLLAEFSEDEKQDPARDKNGSEATSRAG